MMPPSPNNNWTTEVFKQLVNTMQDAIDKMEKNINVKIDDFNRKQERMADNLAVLTNKVDVSIAQQMNDARGMKDAEENSKNLNARVAELEKKCNTQDGAISILKWLVGTLGASNLATLFLSLAAKGH